MSHLNLPPLKNADKIDHLPQLQSEFDLNKALQQIQETLSQFGDENNHLGVILDSTAKHLGAYLRVIKNHLNQLHQVLQLDSHQNRSLDYGELPAPLQQLIQIFQHIEHSDTSMIESLAQETQHWPEKAHTQTETATNDSLHTATIG